MASEQIDLDQIARLLLRSWRLIGGLAVILGVVALAAIHILVPSVHLATARVMIATDAWTRLDGNEFFWLYRPLVQSESTLRQTVDRLIRDGVLPEGHSLKVGQDLTSQEERPAGGRKSGSVIALTARHPDAEAAAAIANTWGQVLIEEGLALFQRMPIDTQAVLDEWLARAGRQIEALESEREQILERFERRQEEAWTRWENRISLAGSESEAADLRRLRDSELDTLSNAQQAALIDHDCVVQPFAELERRIEQEIDDAVLASLSRRANPVSMAAPAVPSRRPAPRRIPVKVSLASLLGVVLGAVIVVFRSFGSKA